MELEAILFDLWGTLIVDSDERSRPRQLWRAGNVAGVLRRHGFDTSTELAAAALHDAGAALSAMHDTGRDISEAGRADLFLQHLPGAPELPNTARRELQEAICAMHPVHRPVVAEGAVEALRETKRQGLATGLISNAGLTSARSLRLMLDDFSLAPLLDVLVFSDDLELAKPDARLFQAAMAQLGVAPEAAAFVGDSPHNDIYGAREAGLWAVQIGHREAPPRTGYAENDGAVPHARISLLSELLPSLRSVGALAAAP